MKVYVFDKKGVSFAKGPLIWFKTEHGYYPIVYLRKPRSVPQEEFDEVIKFIEEKLTQ